MSDGGSIQEIKALLQAQIMPLVQELVPDGRRSGVYWIGRNPTRDDANPGSFWVRLSGPPGVWKDEATGECGDVLKLIEYCARLGEFKAAMRWAREFLRLGEMPAADRQRRAASVQVRNKIDADEMDARAEKMRKAAFGCYVASKKLALIGSPVDAYLRGRGIRLADLGRRPGALGWLPDQRHADTDTRWPAMVAGFTAPNNQIIAVHRTFLATDGSGKAPVAPARKIWPSFGGAAIRLWRGGTKLSIDDAAKHGVREALVLTEGIEDGLSIALAMPDLRVWCAGSLGNMAQITLPECVDEVIVCADNDWGKRQAAQLLDKALAALAAQGRLVRVARSHVGKDANDALCS